MEAKVPPPPERPQLPERPQWTEPQPAGTFLWWLLVGVGGLMLLAILAFLVLPVLWVAFVIALVICLQYVLWGWWFERIYRSQPPKE
jgi:hypothetical protein